MSPALLPHLPQLRHELENCAAMDANVSLLLGLRRTLVRHYHTISYGMLKAALMSLRRPFYVCLTALTVPAPFPAPSWAAQYAQTEQALIVLEQLP